MFVYQKEPKRIEEAGKAAMAFEAFEAARPKETSFLRSHVEQESATHLKVMNDRLTKVETALRNDVRSSAQSRDERPVQACWHCGDRGHLRYRCPELRRPGDPQSCREDVVHNGGNVGERTRNTGPTHTACHTRSA